MRWHVYLLECRNGSIYTGIAIDVEARVQAHGSGRGARYTRANPPQRLLATFGCDSRAAASRAEAAIKRLSAQQKRQLARDDGFDNEGRLALLGLQRRCSATG